MKKGIFVVCGNGFGHFRRSIRVAHSLCEKMDKQLELKIFCKPEQLHKMKKWDTLNDLAGNNRVSFVDFSSNPGWHIDLSCYNEHNLMNWHQHLSVRDFQEADFVVSDNLPGILHLRQDAVLLGSFLWSEILSQRFPDSPLIKKFHEEETDLLRNSHPYMVCLEHMAMPYVLNYTKPVKTAWMAEMNLERKIRDGFENILVTGGGTPNADKIMTDTLIAISSTERFKIYTSLRLANIFPHPSKIQTFDFSDSSFSNMDLMIGRPGIGAATDAVAFSIPFLAVGEDDNPELKHNAAKIEMLGFGLDLYKSEEDICSVLETLNYSESYRQMQEKLRLAPKTGLFETVDFLTTHFRLPIHE